jgi:hypothetical protein
MRECDSYRYVGCKLFIFMVVKTLLLASLKVRRFVWDPKIRRIQAVDIK